MGHPTVLHLIGSLSAGGTERQLVELIERSPAPDRHFVATFAGRGALADTIPSHVHVARPMSKELWRWPTNVATLMELRRLVGRLMPDVLHAHLGHSEVLAPLIAQGVPIVASRRGHNPTFERRWIGRSALSLAHRWQRALVCNSCYLADRARATERHLPPIRVIHNAVDLERFRVAPLPVSDPTVAVIANFRPMKGHLRFLRALRRVVDALPDARAVLVGDGPRRLEIVKEIAALGLEQHVSLVGQVVDPRPYIEGCHLVALTSDYEGFPNALLEGMAMGRAVVATAVGGIPELVRQGQDGRLVPAEGSALAEALVELLSDQDICRAMGRSARERAESFTWDRTSAAWETLYTEVADQGEAR